MLTRGYLDRMGGAGQIWWSDGVTLCLLKIIWIGWGDGADLVVGWGNVVLTKDNLDRMGGGGRFGGWMG